MGKLNKSQDSGGGSLAIVDARNRDPGHRHHRAGSPVTARYQPDRVCAYDEYKRHGTPTLMAGIDLLYGHVHALVKERHRSREFIEFFEPLVTDPDMPSRSISRAICLYSC